MKYFTKKDILLSIIKHNGNCFDSEYLGFKNKSFDACLVCPLNNRICGVADVETKEMAIKHFYRYYKKYKDELLKELL